MAHEHDGIAFTIFLNDCREALRVKFRIQTFFFLDLIAQLETFCDDSCGFDGANQTDS